MASVPAGLVERALQLLDSACDGAHDRDGVGFSASDVRGKGFAAKLRDGGVLSGTNLDWCRNVLPRYRKQLQAAGLDMDAVIEEITRRLNEQRFKSLMVAKFPGRCSACGASFPAGAHILWSSEARTRSHVECPEAIAAPAASPARENPPRPVFAASEPGPLPNWYEDYEPEDDADWGSEPVARDPDAPEPLSVLVPRLLDDDGPLAHHLPGYRKRGPQLRLAAAEGAALDAGTHFVGHAPTGSGKSLPLILALNEWCKRHQGQAIISTNVVALQEQYLLKDLPWVAEHVDPTLTFALVKGLGRYACKHRVALLQEETAQLGFEDLETAGALQVFLDWLAEDGTGDLDKLPKPLPPKLRAEVTVGEGECLSKKCRFYEQCYGRQMQARAAMARLIVANHALLLRDAEVRYETGGFASVIPVGRRKNDEATGEPIPPTPVALGIDECHHLEPVATDAFGVEFGLFRFKRLLDRLQKLTIDHKAYKAAQHAEQQHEEDVRRIQQAEHQYSLAGRMFEAAELALKALRGRLTESRKDALKLGDERAIFTPLIEAVDRVSIALTSNAPDWLSVDELALWEKLGEQTTHLLGDLRNLSWWPLEAEAESWVRYCTADNGESVRLYRKPIEVADLLWERLWTQFPSVLACSATVATDGGFQYWRGRVGMRVGQQAIVPSPFDYPRQALLYIPQDERLNPTAARNPDESLAYYDAVAATIQELLLASRGRALCLFASGKGLNEAYARLPQRFHDAHLVLRQGDYTPQTLIRKFLEADSAILYGLATFWEGIDIQGERLSLVVIDKLPFTPPDDPIYAARSTLINERARQRGRRGWQWAALDEYAVPEVATKMQQGAGRLIRTDTDHGVVAILDPRLYTKRYGSRIVASLPPAKQTSSLDAVRAFF